MPDNSKKDYSNYTSVHGTGPNSGDSVGDEYSIFDMDSHKLERKVLWAKKIDKASFESNLSNTIKTVDNNIATVNEALSSIDSDLAETNSERFYSNAEAVEQREKLTSMQAQLVELSKKLHLLDDSNISNKVDEYNKDLPQVKKGEEMKLMMEQADKINANKKQVGDSKTHYERWVTTPQTKTEQNAEKTKITETTYKWHNWYAYGDNEYEVIKTTYEHIDYSDLISGPLEWPWDIKGSDVKKFQDRITSLGYTLYYNPSSVKYDE